MTKVECPGPGFKGLKWKWIQDHAKEQQERERQSVQQVLLPGSTLNCQQDEPGTCNELPQKAADIHEQQTASSAHPCTTLASSHHVVQSQPCVKAEPANGLPGSGSTVRPAAVQHVLPEESLRVKDEQGFDCMKEKTVQLASRAPTLQTAQSVLDTTDASVPHGSVSVPGGLGAAGGLAGRTTAVITVGSSGLSSPSAAIPPVGLPGRKSLDVVPAAPATSSLVAAAVSPPVPHAGLADTTQPPGTTVAVAGLLTAPAAALTASCIVTPPSATPAPTAPQQVAAASAAQPSSAAPSSALPLATSAARVRLPPARAPSTVAPVAMKGGDDFESMFTPLSSLPSSKSETPRAGLPSRSSGFIVGSQGGAAPAAASGATAAGSTGAAAAHDAGGDRKGPQKKVARMQDSRGNAGQTSAGEQQDGESAPPARSRTPVSQLSPAGGGHSSGAGKEALAPANTAAMPGKAQQQQSAAQPGQPTQQPLQTSVASAQPTQQQQRVQGGKAGKSGDGAVPSAAGTSGAGSAAPVGAGAPAAANRGGAAGDRPGLPASAGSTPAAAPVHSGGEVGERKRPRSEGSKPKSGAFLTGEPLAAAEFALPYGETLADRIKRAKRTTTSSSDQDGHHSYGGSAERLPSHVAAAMVGHLAGGDGQDYAGGAARLADEQSPRPAVSAEAQSRGADPAPGGIPARGSHGITSGAAAAGGAGVSGTGDGGAGTAVKQEPQRQRLVANACRSGFQPADRGNPPNHPAQNPSNNNLRMSGGGAVTDSSGGGPAGAQRASGPLASGKAAAAAQPQSGAQPSTGLKRSTAEVARRHNLPPAKFPRSDPHLPRPHQPHNQDRRSAGAAAETPGATAAAAAAGGGRPGSGLPPPPCSKMGHRASSGQPAGRTDGVQSQGADGQGLPAGAAGTGQAPASGTGPPHPASRAGRAGEGDMPAAGSCKGPVVAGSRGSKDGAGDKGACGPRHIGDGVDAACGGGGPGGGGHGAAGTTTTEPKTDSDTRTSRVVECFFEFDLSCRGAAVSASISGLGSGSSLQGAPPGLAARLGGGRFLGAAAAPSSLPPSRSGGATAASQLLDLGKIRSFKELWTQLAALYDGTLPDEMDSKIIYLDEEGDWIMVTPDEPWSSVAAAATKVLVTNRT